MTKAKDLKRRVPHIHISMDADYSKRRVRYELLRSSLSSVQAFCCIVDRQHHSDTIKVRCILFSYRLAHLANLSEDYLVLRIPVLVRTSHFHPRYVTEAFGKTFQPFNLEAAPVVDVLHEAQPARSCRNPVTMLFPLWRLIWRIIDLGLVSPRS